MIRTVLIIIVAIMVLLTLFLWATQVSGNLPELLMLAGGLLVVGLALYMGYLRLKSTVRKEAPEDELSRKIMIRAAALSYHISIYLWLLMMYISYSSSMPAHSLIAAGILGMAIIFFGSWLGVKYLGLKHE